MSKLNVVQIAHLSQDLINHVTMSVNLITRSKYEFDRIQQLTKMLCQAYENFENDWRDEHQW